MTKLVLLQLTCNKMQYTRHHLTNDAKIHTMAYIKNSGDSKSLSCSDQDSPMWLPSNMLDVGEDRDAGYDYARMILRNVGDLKLHGIVSSDMSTLLPEGAVDVELIPERDQETFTPLYQNSSRVWPVTEKSKVILESAMVYKLNTTADCGLSTNFGKRVLAVEASTDSDEFKSSFKGYFVIYQDIYQESAQQKCNKKA